MRVVILGGTKGMGRAIAQQLAERGDEVFLLGRDPAELQRSTADLTARAGGKSAALGNAVCDLERPETFASALAAASAFLGGIDAVVITAGLFATQPALEADLAFTQRMLTVNYVNTVLFCEHARPLLLAQSSPSARKQLVVFSSVAGDRGRKPVILYGSSKAGLSAYLEGLDHKFHAQGLQVLCVKPGFVKTAMTAGLSPPPFAGEPEQVARDVVRAMDAGKPLLYTPRPWALVMWVIRLLPRFVMRKIGF